jgi:periplasmic divalent cation tolerance protein
MILVCLSTFPDVEVARRISGVLVEEGLVACANLLPGVESIYTWQGKRESGAEVLAVLKTTEAGFPALEKRLLELHPYEVPELIALPAVQAAAAYAAWVAEHSRGAEAQG